MKAVYLLFVLLGVATATDKAAIMEGLKSVLNTKYTQLSDVIDNVLQLSANSDFRQPCLTACEDVMNGRNSPPHMDCSVGCDALEEVLRTYASRGRQKKHWVQDLAVMLYEVWNAVQRAWF